MQQQKNKNHKNLMEKNLLIELKREKNELFYLYCIISTTTTTRKRKQPPNNRIQLKYYKKESKRIETKRSNENIKKTE